MEWGIVWYTRERIPFPLFMYYTANALTRYIFLLVNILAYEYKLRFSLALVKNL